MDVKQLMLQSKTVKKSNALARARWSPDSIWEPRLVALLAAQIKSGDTDFQTYEIRLVDLLGNEPGGKDYKELKEAVYKAMSRVIVINDDKGWSMYNLFSKCRLNNQRGTLEICFHPDLKEHYLQLKQYIKYNLLEFILLPSIYSQRLFEFLKSWDDQKETIIELTELHKMLDAPKSFTKDFRQFRIRVLEKAHKDINEHTSLKYQWEPIKVGRSVQHIKFIFIKPQPKKLEVSPEAKALVRQALGVGSPDELQEKRKAVQHDKFLKFIAKFKHKGSIYEAGSIWHRLHATGNAPLACDVPDDNELSPLHFLTQWQKERG